MRKAAQLRRHLRSSLIVHGLLCAFSCLLAAQRYSFRQYTDGLGNLNIDSMVQDHTGYLWVGTQNGLYRYDGTQFQSFGPAQGLPERMIQNLFVSPDGTLWVATTTGIFFETKDGRFAPVQASGPASQFLQRSGSVFTAHGPDQVATVTRSGAFEIRRLAGEQWVSKPMHLQGGSLWSAQYAPDGSLWYGCDSDLCRLTKGKTTRLRHTLNLPDEKWTNLLFARDGHLWIRGSHHVGEIDPAAVRFQPREVPGTTDSEAYPELVEDAKGRILTSHGPSLVLWDSDHWRFVTDRNGLSRFEIQALFVDREGSVWIGVVGHGLLRWVGQDRWEGYTAADGLSNDLVWSVMRDRMGRLWIGTESGLDYIPAGDVNPKEWRAPGILTTRAGSFAQSNDGAIWVGSAGGAVVRIDPRTLAGTQWKLPEAYDLLIDHDDRLWIATNSGLYTLNASAQSHTPQLVEASAFGDVHQRFSDLALDPSGTVWAAADEGLFVHDGGGWHRIDTGNTGAKPDLIAVDQQGWLWAAGASQDLMRLRVSGYRVVEAHHIGCPPLLSEQAVSLLVDHMGWVWVGQDKGISVFDGDAWHSYTQDDGLIWNDTDSFALAEEPNGSVWIGTSGGLSHLITPGYLPLDAPQAPVISQVSYGASFLSSGASVKWSSSPLDISVALLSFKGTQEAGIRYRLVGSQASEWETTRDMQIHYRHLAPGNYRFEVALTDLSGKAISPIAAVSFRILPLWWQNGFLRTGLTLVLLASIIAIWRRRVGHLMHQKRQLESAVKQRTTDLEREKTELMRTREQMRHYAEHDDLTGLWNHRIVVERLRIEVERSRREGLPLSIVLADLDFFKRINDTYGHPAGDRALKEASAVFKRMVRSYDWVGRYGGEEFLLIMPGSGFMSTRQRAEELRKAIEDLRVEDGGNVIPITSSFGVASGFPADHEELIRIADAALYRAKRNGRNCVVTTEIDVRQDAVRQAETEILN